MVTASRLGTLPTTNVQTFHVADVDAVKEGRADAVPMTGMQKMASRMWLPWTIMGLMIVGAAFIVGIFNSANLAEFFSLSKVAREGNASFSADTLGAAKAISAWLPTMKFFGLGMMLGGITFLLATILGNLRVAGGNLQASLGIDIKLPKPPIYAKLFPMMMMLGMGILIAALVIGAAMGTLAGSIYENEIAGVINQAKEGSLLLADQGTFHAIQAWLTPMKFVGMAFLFTGIALALVTIITVLRFQAQRLVEIADELTRGTA